MAVAGTRRLSWALAIALGAAGCFSDRGVAIEVDVGDTRATAVELYLGKTACDRSNPAGIACTTIAPPDGTSPLRGTIWFRDDVSPYTAAVKGHTATFQLTAETPTTLPIVIAVGTVPGDPDVRGVGAATLTDLAIPVHSARVVTTTLAAANPVVPGQGPATGAAEDRVLVWAKHTPPSSCVVVEHWSHGQAMRDFVVPAEDPDCDDVSAPECNPAAYHGARASGGADGAPQCLATAAGQPCVLGNLGCRDGVPGYTGPCVPQGDQVCVPQLFCECTGIDAACLQMKLDLGASVPHVDCDVPLTDQLGVCPGPDSTMISLDPGYPAGTSCGDAPMFSSLQLASYATTHDFAGITMELGKASAPCEFEIKAAGGTRNSLVDGNEYGAIRLDTASGGLLLPIVLHFRRNACATVSFACNISPTGASDSLWSCVR